MRPKTGFTLIEVLVALSIGSVVLLLADRMFVGVADAGRVLAATREALDRDANTRRWLQAAFRSVSVGARGDVPFDGEPSRLQCTTWTMTPEGWFHPAALTLEVQGHQLRATLGSADPIVLADSVAAIRFDYLLALGADAPWASGWISPQSPPLAVRLRLFRVRTVVVPAQVIVDTLLLVIGPRG